MAAQQAAIWHLLAMLDKICSWLHETIQADSPLLIDQCEQSSIALHAICSAGRNNMTVQWQYHHLMQLSNSLFPEWHRSLQLCHDSIESDFQCGFSFSSCRLEGLSMQSCNSCTLLMKIRLSIASRTLRQAGPELRMDLPGIRHMNAAISIFLPLLIASGVLGIDLSSAINCSLWLHIAYCRLMR
jgi:hypothetical protein